MENSISNPGKPASGIANDIQRGTATANAALNDKIDKMADPARSTVDRVSAAAHQTVDKLSSQASSVAGQLSDQTTRVLDDSKSWIQDKPLEAVGIALAVGYVLGRLSGR
jgi:ElaB/YqjD/DUF883 family membrane-anchored ribosome-binding protein